jgi:lipoprotein-anchoring transpeptidase ErfK/SrfK
MKFIEHSRLLNFGSFYRHRLPLGGTRVAISAGPMRFLHLTIGVLGLLAAPIFSATSATAAPSLVVSVPDQTLALVDGGRVLERYPVSTSKFGLGDRSGSYATPLGSLQIASKIGANAPLGTVFKSRHPTGEILKPNAPGRDPIVTRILWLRGLEQGNARAYSRNIYIHGTPVEQLIGRPVSFGCIRMRSKDVVRLFGMVSVGTRIDVRNTGLTSAVAQATVQPRAREVKVAKLTSRSSRVRRS